MTTKDQELAALTKIRKIVADLGEDSYLGSAFDGAFELAEQNIEDDAAYTTSYYIKHLHELQTAMRLAETQKAKEINELEKQVAKLTAALENEQEWKPYESERNVSQSAYERLATCIPGAAHYMTDDEATEWICSEFDFDPRKITIIHEIDEEEINRHRQCRNTGKKIDRRPIYCATDYHYIRFNTSHWYYEAWNGQLREFYC